MSHSDSEIRAVQTCRGDSKIRSRKHLDNELKKKIKIHPFCRTVEFKAKNICPFSRQEVRKLKDRLGPILGIRLVHAVNTNNVERVKMLLERGVNPNSSDCEKRSALHVAVSRGYADIVDLLLKHGANPNKRDIIQNTPLHLAACVHNLSIVTMLINANADVRCLDLHGRNPFQLASSKLQILQKSWKDGTIEMIKLKQELQDENFSPTGGTVIFCREDIQVEIIGVTQFCTDIDAEFAAVNTVIVSLYNSDEGNFKIDIFVKIL